MFVEVAVTALLLTAGGQQSSEPLVIEELPSREESEQRPVTGLEAFGQVCEDWDEWDKPAPPSSIGPHLYYVGTCGITTLILSTSDGVVLIDTGPREAAEAVAANIRTMGLDPANIRLILTSHEHHDHVGGVSWFQALSGAPVAVLPAAAEVMRTGVAGDEDPQAGVSEPMNPVANVVVLEPDEPVTFGGTTFHPIATPGHTSGAVSWQFEICFGRTCQTYVYADSLSPVSSDEYRFSDHPDYVQAYRDGLARLAALDCDILLTPHPSASDMIARALSGHFDNGPSCAQYAASIEARLDARLAEEAGE